MAASTKYPSIDDGEFSGLPVLLRVDINSPIDHSSGKIVNDNRIVKSIPTIRDLLSQGARLTIMAHQGDTTDYRSLISLKEHAQRLAALLGQTVHFIEDVAGPAAVNAINALKDGEVLLLDNIRYLTEEASTFEDSVEQTPAEMGQCYLVRRLAPLFKAYVNDAFAAAHRNSPSMVGFQPLMPSYAGKDGSADKLLLSGLIGQIFMLADGINIGASSAGFISVKGFDSYIGDAQRYLQSHRDKIIYPTDVAVSIDNKRLLLKSTRTSISSIMCLPQAVP